MRAAGNLPAVPSGGLSTWSRMYSRARRCQSTSPTIPRIIARRHVTVPNHDADWINSKPSERPLTERHVSRRDVVVQTEHLSPPAASWLAERCELIVCPHDDPRFSTVIADAA